MYLERINTLFLDKNLRSVVKSTQGLLYLYQGDLKKGTDFFSNAQEEAEEGFSGIVRQKYLLELGNYHYKNKQIMRALNSWKKASEIQTDPRFFDFRSEAERQFQELSFSIQTRVAVYKRIVTKYLFLVFPLMLGFILSASVYLKWKLGGQLVVGIQPFDSLCWSIGFLIWLTTSLAGAIYYAQRIRLLNSYRLAVKR